MGVRTLMLGLLMVVTAVVAGGCRGPGTDGDSAPGSASIGARGGAVMSADGAVCLEVPVGALDQSVTIRLTPGTVADVPQQSRDVAEVTRVVRLEPDGLVFAKPARISIRFPATKEGDRASAPLRPLVSRSGDRIERLAQHALDIDLGAGDVTVSADLTHFSEVWDNLPKGSGVTVMFAGVPSTWTVGPEFQAAAIVVYGPGKVTVTGIYLADNGTEAPLVPPVRNKPDGSTAPAERALVVSEERGDAVAAGVYSASLPYACRTAGDGLWAGKVILSHRDLEDYVMLLAVGAPGMAAEYTAGAHRTVRCTGGTVQQPTAAPSVRTGSPVASTATPTASPTGANRRPVVSAIASKIAAPVTTYSIEAEDPDGDALTYTWSMTGEACGTERVPWTKSGAATSVTWSHGADLPDRCTHLTREHGVLVTIVVIEAGTPRLRCTIPGSEDRRLDNPICESIP